MNLQQLRTSTRIQVDDAVQPYLVGDPTLDEFANEAQEEACRRARLLVDSSTADVCHIAVAAGADFVELDPRIIFVRRVLVVGQSRPLAKASHKDLDKMGTEWLEETGEVMAWVPDLETGRIRLYRKPEQDIALRLTVVRLPLADMADDNDTPEIKLQMHRQLIHWMRYRFYSLPDAQVNDPRKAQEALAAFEEQFGVASTAANELWIEQKHGFDEDEGLY